MEREAIVEMCTCGHPQTMHKPSVHNVNGARLEVEGHGACGECDCQQYTWCSGR